MANIYDNNGNVIDVGGSVTIQRQLILGVPIAKINGTQLYAPQGGGGGGDTGETVITAIGSSGFDINCGGQYQLTNEQKETYGVTTNLTVTKVLQVLLGYDKANILAYSGNTASQIFFKNGMACYRLKNAITLPKNKSDVSYTFSTSTIEAQMTANLANFVASQIKGTDVIINGTKARLHMGSSFIRLNENDLPNDVAIPAGAMVYTQFEDKVDVGSGIVRQNINYGTTGLLLQIGANAEGATTDEIVEYFEEAIKQSKCKWFICMRQNTQGDLDYSTCETTGATDLNKAAAKLRKKYGTRYIEHMNYMCSLRALQDQGITPTTSDDYPDLNGVNSNPLTPTQIANNVPCDMECIANQRVPSSFWHSAYRDDDEQTINSGHFNAQGLECLGKYLYRMVVSLGLV